MKCGLVVAAKPGTKIPEPRSLTTRNERHRCARGDESFVTFDGLLIIVPNAKRDFSVTLMTEMFTEVTQDIGPDGFCGFGGDAAVVVGDRVVGIEHPVLRRQDEDGWGIGRVGQILPQNVERWTVVSNNRWQQASGLLLRGRACHDQKPIAGLRDLDGIRNNWRLRTL